MDDELAISGRQRQIAEYAAQGLTDKEIAGRLLISEGTLRTYWDRLRSRLGAQSRTEIVARLLQSRFDELQTERDELLAILSALPVMVWTARPCGTVDFCNDVFVAYAGLDESRCLGPGCRILMPEDELPESTIRWERAQTSGVPYESQVRFRDGRDGALRWHQIRLIPLRNAAGEVYRWIGTAHHLFPQPLVARPASQRL